MLAVTLRRFALAPDGAFGILTLPSGRELWTAERPWRDNQPRVSCIPPGRYQCGPRRYFRGGYDAIEVRDVPGRSDILFHRGNRPRDVQGCIVVGVRRGCVAGEWGVLGSSEAFDQLMAEVGGETFELTVTGPAE
jgi:hypothetical protein